MTLTPEQIRQNAAAMIAFAEGKPIQWRSIQTKNDIWSDVRNPGWSFDAFEYRPKPTPVIRDWNRPQDVPLNCWLKSKTGGEHFITSICASGVFTSENYIPWNDLKYWLQSTDRKTWFPCIMEVEG